jgi:hypothetical protein
MNKYTRSIFILGSDPAFENKFEKVYGRSSPLGVDVAMATFQNWEEPKGVGVGVST